MDSPAAEPKPNWIRAHVAELVVGLLVLIAGTMLEGSRRSSDTLSSLDKNQAVANTHLENVVKDLGVLKTEAKSLSARIVKHDNRISVLEATR